LLKTKSPHFCELFVFCAPGADSVRGGATLGRFLLRKNSISFSLPTQPKTALFGAVFGCAPGADSNAQPSD